MAFPSLGALTRPGVPPTHPHLPMQRPHPGERHLRGAGAEDRGTCRESWGGTVPSGVSHCGGPGRGRVSDRGDVSSSAVSGGGRLPAAPCRRLHRGRTGEGSSGGGREINPGLNPLVKLEKRGISPPPIYRGCSTPAGAGAGAAHISSAAEEGGGSAGPAPARPIRERCDG